MIRYVEGNVLDSAETVIAHGCNARGGFASGFAGVVRTRMPEAYLAYRAAYERDGGLVLGSIVWARHGDRFIANCITQPTYGRTGIHVDYDAVRGCMRELNRVGRDGDGSIDLPRGYRRVAMPLIGAGLGGGDWSVIAGIVSEELVDVEATVYFLPGSGFVPPDAGPFHSAPPR